MEGNASASLPLVQVLQQHLSVLSSLDRCCTPRAKQGAAHGNERLDQQSRTEAEPDPETGTLASFPFLQQSTHPQQTPARRYPLQIHHAPVVAHRCVHQHWSALFSATGAHRLVSAVARVQSSYWQRDSLAPYQAHVW